MQDPIESTKGFANLVGYELTTWREGYAEITLLVEAKHLNRSGVLHGGVLCTLMDSACGYAVCYTSDLENPRRAFTLSLNTHYLATVSAGESLRVTARKTGGGSRIFFVRCEAVSGEGRVVGQGEGVFRARSGKSQ